MKLLKFILICLVAFFLIITAFASLIPSSIRISKVVDIACSPAALMEQISNPKQWKNWYPGLETAAFLYKNQKVNGYIISETKKQFLVLKEIKADAIETELLSANKKIVSGWRIIAVKDSASVGLQWYMDFELGWLPWEKFSSLFYENIFGKSMEQGLTRLKILLEV